MAEAAEIVETLETLALHCRPPLMSVEDRSRWLRDWCNDLREFRIEEVRQAAMKWRRGESQKFPTPGQFLPVVRSLVRSDIAPKVAEPWRELSDDEYRALTLEGKIRHQTILASEARKKAGPMWRGGRPAKPGELPQRWHIWTAKAQNHEAEVKTLRGILEHHRAKEDAA
jgi:hypothetical protein